MEILLIAGHGAGDVGAVGNGYKEADLTREVVALIKPKLDKYAEVTIADTSKNWFESRNSLNAKGYDYVLEVHFNAFKADSGDGKTKGTEIYVTTSEKGVGVEMAIVGNIAKLGLTNRGVKRKDYSVISTVKSQGVSAALLEVCFIDDKDDMNIYLSKKNEIIDAIVEGIVAGFGLTSKTEPAKSEAQKPSTWAADAFNKATEKGILDGTNPQGIVTREMLAVVLDRLKLL